MNELRQGKIHSKRWVVLAPKRAKRPSTRVWKKKQCFFCPGNEKLTPPEIYRIEEGGKWQVRVFPNKFPAFSPNYPDAYGLHWVIVETPNHDERLFEVSNNHMEKIVQAYSDMIKKASETKGINCVLLFKNEGKEAGMSSTHLHSQVIGTKRMFPHFEEEFEECRSYYAKKGRCIYCDHIREERKSKRFVYESKHFTVITPYASLYPYSVMIFPKKHQPDFTKLNDGELSDFAGVLKKVLAAVHSLGYGYNFYIHTSNRRYHHFHLEIRPRPNIYAGFELGSGIVINTVTPEQAAKYFRAKIKN